PPLAGEGVRFSARRGKDSPIRAQMPPIGIVEFLPDELAPFLAGKAQYIDAVLFHPALDDDVRDRRNVTAPVAFLRNCPQQLVALDDRLDVLDALDRERRAVAVEMDARGDAARPSSVTLSVPAVAVTWPLVAASTAAMVSPGDTMR